jgi:hypothetical protein
MKKLIAMLAVGLVALLALPVWSSSPTEEAVEYGTNFTATVVSSTSSASPVVATNRAFRVMVQVINDSTENLSVNLGTTCGTNIVLRGQGSSYTIQPPIKYYGSVSVRNSANNANGRVIVHETWRSTP